VAAAVAVTANAVHLLPGVLLHLAAALAAPAIFAAPVSAITPVAAIATVAAIAVVVVIATAMAPIVIAVLVMSAATAPIIVAVLVLAAVVIAVVMMLGEGRRRRPGRSAQRGNRRNECLFHSNAPMRVVRHNLADGTLALRGLNGT